MAVNWINNIITAAAHIFPLFPSLFFLSNFSGKTFTSKICLTEAEKSTAFKKGKVHKMEWGSVTWFQLPLGRNNMAFENNKSRSWRLYKEIRKNC